MLKNPIGTKVWFCEGGVVLPDVRSGVVEAVSDRGFVVVVSGEQQGFGIGPVYESELEALKAVKAAAEVSLRDIEDWICRLQHPGREDDE